MAETWPEGTLARYLTPGGATVDVEQGDNEQEVVATCRGCGDDRTSNSASHEPSRPDRHIQVVRSWAQAHAEWCRAIPRP